MKKLKSIKIFLPLLLCLLFAATALASSIANTSQSNIVPPAELKSNYYIGDVNTHVFHTPYCSYARRINTCDKITFYTRQEAINTGYDPCEHCHP
ncbi:MAG: hypothetical protein LLG02_17075 [Pelosinus sp.]|nr:hypothetical protein [Pelosinus sp.]